MAELLAKRVQQQPGLAAGGVGPRPSVELVANDREAEAGQVHTDLVTPAGKKLDRKQGPSTLESELAHERARGFSLPFFADAHLFCVMTVAADGHVDGLLGPRKAACDDGEVLLAHIAPGHLSIEGGLRGGIEREEHKPRGLDVEALRRLRAHVLTALRRKVLGHEVREREGACAVAVHEQVRRLARREQVFVLENHGDVFVRNTVHGAIPSSRRPEPSTQHTASRAQKVCFPHQYSIPRRPVVDDVRIPRANEDSPGNDQETLQVLRPDGTLGESDEDMEARLAMESLMRHRRARRRKKLIAGGIVGAIVLVGAIAWGVSKFTGNAGGDDAPQLMTTFVDRGDFTEAVEASGAAKPVTSVVVNPEVAGTIESVNVAEGDTVQEGDVLLTVKNDELDKAIRDAEMGVRDASIGVTQAEQEYSDACEKYNNWIPDLDKDENEIGSKREGDISSVNSAKNGVDRAYNSLSDAQEAYNIAVANAEKRTVRAPKGGSVVVMNAQVGASTDSAANAGGLIQIADLSQMTVKVQVNEVDISRVSVGQMAKATFSALPGVELDAQVTRIATVAGSGEDSHGYGGGVVTYDVSLLIPQPAAELKPGMTANVQIMLQSVPDTLMVPSSCVAMDETGGSYVMVVTDYETGAIERRSVTVRASDQTTSAIEGDVSEGDEVLLDPYSAPSDDAPMDGGPTAVEDGSGSVSADSDAAVAEDGAEPAADIAAESVAATDTAA